jgi:hypothetical protein
VSTAWQGVAFRAGGIGPTISARNFSLCRRRRASIMPDLAFVLLTVALFAGLALAVRAVERL